MKCFLRLAALAAILTLRVPAAPATSARCAVVMDAGSGEILYESRADEKSLIASTTKIMTGYLACSLVDLDAEIEIPPEAVGVEGSSLYLKAGERLTGDALLYGMMLHSGNDAATALAIAGAGSEADFVARMNREAESLGLTNTRFANPHGLDDENNYSTARDLAVLTAAALRDENFRRVVSARTKTIGGRVLTNHNKLLWTCEGCIGVKTGYTKAAGRILVSAAERDGRTLICVTIHDPNDWADHKALYDWAFARCPSRTAPQTSPAKGRLHPLRPTQTYPDCPGSDRT